MITNLFSLNKSIGGIIAGIVVIKVAFAATGGAWVIYQLMNCCNSSTKYIWGL
jgi:hypothetical protein